MSDRLMSPEDLARVTGCVTFDAQVHWFESNGLKPVKNSTPEVIMTKETWAKICETRTLKTVLPTLEDALIPRPIPRDKSGVYFLMDGDEVVYVGQSINLIKRLADHTRAASGWTWDRALHLPIDAAMLDLVEMEFIVRLRPRYNKAGLVRRGKHAATDTAI